jgi:thiosulfate/3-mercaptopyruvate sulfurtransferase
MNSGYARPEMLVEAEWLAAHLEDAGLRIVDADLPQSYARAHIPGAVGHLSEDVYLKTAVGEPFIMGPEKYAETMAKMGICDETTVVAYDANRGLNASRLWWTLQHYGHTNVRVLNGGWHKWLLEGRPVTMAPAQAVPAQFTARVNADISTDCALLKSVVGREDVAILDVRNRDEYTGVNGRGNQRRGHVPGAVHIEWTNFVTDDERKVFKPAAELREMLTAQGVTPDKNVFVYWQAGIRASHGTFVLKLLGYDRVRSYDGSMREWANREDTPLVV